MRYRLSFSFFKIISLERLRQLIGSTYIENLPNNANGTLFIILIYILLTQKTDRVYLKEDSHVTKKALLTYNMLSSIGY